MKSLNIVEYINIRKEDNKFLPGGIAPTIEPTHVFKADKRFIGVYIAVYKNKVVKPFSKNKMLLNFHIFLKISKLKLSNLDQLSMD